MHPSRALHRRIVLTGRLVFRNQIPPPSTFTGRLSCFLDFGKHFLAWFQADSPQRDHYCIAIADYQVQKVTDILRQQGLKPRQPRGTERVYFPDPGGLEIQLSSVDHRA
jgi:hypothetical protein